MTRYFCISLHERSDRRDKIKEIFQKLTINVEYMLVDPHTKGGMYGCYESHLALWGRIANSNMKDGDIAVIFEDDIMIKRQITSEDFLKLLEISSQVLSEYDIVHFGRTIEKTYGEIIRYKEWSFWDAVTTEFSMYVISAGRARQNLELMETGFGKGHIDIFAKKHLNQVALYPETFVQRDLFDTNNTWSDNHLQDILLRHGACLKRTIEPLHCQISAGLNHFLSKFN